MELITIQGALDEKEQSESKVKSKTYQHFIIANNEMGFWEDSICIAKISLSDLFELARVYSQNKIASRNDLMHLTTVIKDDKEENNARLEKELSDEDPEGSEEGPISP